MSGGNSGWANPLPAGLTSLAVACFIFYALMGGKVTAGALPLMGSWLIGAFIVQLVVAIIELKEGALNGGNVFLFFSAFFCFATGVNMFIKFFAALNKWAIPVDGRIDGWAWVALGIVLIPITFCYLKKTPLSMNLMVLCLDFVVLCLIILDLGLATGATWKPLCSYGCLGAGIFALYTVAALFVNTNFEKTILPMPGPIMK